LIFDEADAGIGGAVADAVGERLAKLAGKRQVLVVTHAPQVAARAGDHYIVAKTGTKDVKTNVMHIDQKQRREEIARMLSGANVTDEARRAADKLLETGT
jgi:DNA repair protein RecN (Recombination protein N)